ncbi:aromatic ring-opening dioxygenase LigA [Xylanimonas oleitrophica]|uniref:Aromatic ring-opening dioxygenase LigA n=1 Tax=Xylanimonas oleitrophica TaxID=2607479 RepID=A0A2W5XUF0_9MICO|nr:aromatic ring-opening dioxygenase LigA [Xylanimonas oleitrophica]PZR53878.1 aromatic ring-opening dioxygenase LigA [Xylanimonas oleitrophica]
MSTNRTARTVGLVALVAGILMIAVGATTWGIVTSQLSAQNVTVADDASFLAGDKVDGPFSALAQAQIIDHHAMAATDGKTYAEMDKDDPLRATAMNASFLRASLFTSVIAYGVSALVMGMGVLVGLIGWTLRSLGTAPAAATDAKAVRTATAPALATA